MYKEYFGFAEIPFSIAPDPRYLYLSEQHREALAHLLYGVKCDGGFVLLTGEVGTGKTTVCRCFLEQIPDHCDIAYILNPRLTVRELLSTICDEFRISYPRSNKSIKVFVDLINGFLLDSHAKGRKSLLIIDEAQNLSSNVLEQIRLLTNLETHERKLLQIILLGQPELRDMLALPTMRQLAQRIVARYHLGPLKKEEVPAYVNHRLSVAGLQKKVFAPSTIDKIYRLSGGIPRLINVLCDRALLGAYVRGKEEVDKSTLVKAAREVFGEDKTKKKSGGVRRWLQPALAFMMCLAAVAVLYAYRLIPMVTFKATSTDQGVIISTLVRKPIWAPSKAEVASSHELEESEKKKDESVEPLAVVELKAGSASANEGHQTVGRNDPAEPPAEKPQVPQGQTAEGTRTESARAFERGDSDGGWGEIPSGSLEWPAGQPISQSEDLANQTLFTLWGVEYDPRKNQWACDQANSQGLRCLVGNGGLDELKTFDRPAVLKLYNSDGRAFFATLKSLSGETATLLLGGKKSIVDIHEIALRWRGDYMLLWRPPPSYKGPIREGDSGPVVEWLYARLARLRGESGPRPDKVVFDRAMIEEVKKFQIEAGLKPDGMVGTRTLIRLGTEAESGVPLLVTRKENRG